MKEQLISLETAQLAKEKGFDWECIESYDPVNSELYPVGLLSNNPVTLENFLIDYNYYDNHISAPTQSLLQKWLREKHNFSLLATVDTYESGDYSFEIWKTLVGEEPYMKMESSTNWETYEQALEEGLKEALKLINNEQTTI